MEEVNDVFFDCVYYLQCKFYKRFKDERDLDSWRASGIIMVSALSSLFVTTIIILYAYICNLSKYELLLLIRPWTLVLCGLLLIVFIIRYNKFTSYKEIYLKVEQISKHKVWVLDILSLLYFFIAFPGMLATAIYLGSINNP